MRISVCNATRDRNSPATAYQINLRRSPIAVIINRFAGDQQPFWVYGRDRCPSFARENHAPKIGKPRPHGWIGQCLDGGRIEPADDLLRRAPWREQRVPNGERKRRRSSQGWDYVGWALRSCDRTNLY